jgi:phosphorylase/glycogen(starch) synthase
MLLERKAKTAHLLAQWKVKVAQNWDDIQVVKVNYTDSKNDALKMGDKFVAEVSIDLKDLKAEDIGIEFVYGQKNIENQITKYIGVYPLIFERKEAGVATYRVEISTQLSGVYDFAFRIFPTNPLLPHRQDFPLIKWC